MNMIFRNPSLRECVAAIDRASALTNGDQPENVEKDDALDGEGLKENLLPASKLSLLSHLQVAS